MQAHAGEGDKTSKVIDRKMARASPVITMSVYFIATALVCGNTIAQNNTAFILR
jgi:hypothetical protein